MWAFQGNNNASSPSGDGHAPESQASSGSALERYRTYGRFYERYWANLFGMTQADMTRFATQMREAGEGLTLTDLARDVILARLQAGPQLTSSPALNNTQPGWIVRQWDPGAAWRAGDRTIVAIASPSRGRAYAPCVGEVIHVKSDCVVINIDGLSASQVFGLGHGAYPEESAAAEAEILGISQQVDEASQVDFVLWRYGAQVVGRLLHALDADDRFVELEGRWFLRELAIPPSDRVLSRLSETMFLQNSGPLRLDDVIALLSLGFSERSAVRFGLAQALGERPELFKNVGTASHPRWALSGPPTMPYTAVKAAYDPDTYAVLCVPGDRLSPDVVERLWSIGLLRAVLGDSGSPVLRPEPRRSRGNGLPQTQEQLRARVRPAPSAVHDEPDLTQPPPAPAPPPEDADARWRRWLRFSRG